MPLLVLLAGLLLIVAGIKNTIGSLAGHIAQDVQAQQDGSTFISWFAAIIVIGSLGFIPQLRTISRALLMLVILVVMLKNNGGFFQAFVSQISNPPAPAKSQASVPSNLPAIPVQFSGSSTGGTAGKSSTGSAVGGTAGSLSGIPGGGLIGSIIGGFFG